MFVKIKSEILTVIQYLDSRYEYDVDILFLFYYHLQQRFIILQIWRESVCLNF